MGEDIHLLVVVLDISEAFSKSLRAEDPSQRVSPCCSPVVTTLALKVSML